ncbi:MAG TPA: AraC family transcriptional regulator [Alphaproteobacteria bacterium]|nr:AraC family transcriptional regulator [Alphaproteobacteria bacterium]
MSRRASDTHRFWRDPALPALEARLVEGGRAVCYEMHSHPTFSIGVVTGGRSDYRIGRARHEVAAGAVVAMNPEEAHACNPRDGLPWSYRMLHVDVPWLAAVQQRDAFRPGIALLGTDPALFRRLNRLFDLLFDADADILAKESAATALFADLHHGPGREADPAGDPHAGLERAAAFIAAHYAEPLRLADICAASGLSPSYLVRAFKARYGLTPHAYQLNRRIQHGRRELRRGRPIVDVALEAGFADQAHFQRVFKRHVAATPGQFAAG